MDISIITPIYYGKKYLKNYLNCININCKKMNNVNVEVIFVNDSPDENIIIENINAYFFKIKIINNFENMGIHKSRVNGLANAKGKYIIFLDQDDLIDENTLITQYKKINYDNSDIVISNGYYEFNGKKYNIYDNKISQKFAIKETPNLMVKNFIISPGQAIIKKDIIPSEWKYNIIKKNGADDFLLWLILFDKNAKITCNYEKLYMHKETGENVSNDNDKMFNSIIELIKVLKKINYNLKKLKKLEKSVRYKYNYKKHFFKETIKNLDVFLYNIYYKIFWRGFIKK